MHVQFALRLGLIYTNIVFHYISAGMWWLRHWGKNWNVVGSFPDGVFKIFHWHNHSGRNMALGSTRPLTEMSTRNISWGKGGRCMELTILLPSCADCLENLEASNSWSPKDLSRSVQGLLYFTLFIFSAQVWRWLYEKAETWCTFFTIKDPVWKRSCDYGWFKCWFVCLSIHAYVGISHPTCKII
jgi:hypothetical protein